MKKKKMNRFIAGAGAIAMVASLCPTALPLQKNVVKAASISCQMESLDRGLVAVKSNGGVFLSWRLLGTENYSTTFNVYRNGKKIAGPISNSTNYFDASGSTSNSYYVRSVVNGKEATESDTIKPWSNKYKDIPINRPGSNYATNDATVADVDGDGAYEIILKWDPNDSQDNSKSGKTSNVYIDCYELDGTQRWRIDLGKNIRAGAHYTQMSAFDFDGDGKAELALKTADGTKDGTGKVIGDASKDYRNSGGYILSGPEYLTMFNGATGKAMTTINYSPARGNVSDWGDKYGNRVDRFLCGVAYLDGKTPSLIECRGYYAKSMLVAYKYANGKFTTQWTFTANGSQNSSYCAQGAHSLSIADVDGDGYDEIIYGSAVIDHNGKGLYSTGQGHGDALHCGDFDPKRAGLEILMVHENKASNIESVQMRDAKTGKTIWGYKRQKDMGRGLILNAAKEFSPYVVLADNAYDSKGNVINSGLKNLGENFAMLWDGDLYQEGLDGTSIRKWNSSTKRVDYILSDSGVHSCNSTKSTPTLSGDILGDWREEVIWGTNDNKALRIYTTDYVTQHKLYTLTSDRQYREAIAWQNVAYNQPPHTSYYIGEDMATPSKPNMYTVGSYALKKASGTAQTPAGNVEAPVDEGTYMLKNVSTGLYMDVAGGKAADNTNIQQWGASSASVYNTWKLVKDANGYYTLCSLVGDGSNYVMDVASKNTADGTNVNLYSTKGTDNQKFQLVKCSDGSFAILTKITASASCVEVASGANGAGGNVQQSAYTGNANQRWYLEKATVATPAPVITNGTLVSNMTVADADNRADWKIVKNLSVGTQVYGDRDVTFATVPSALVGAEYIQTACDSKIYAGDLASFKAGDDITVYVGLDTRLTTIPSWLNAWTKTDVTMKNSNDVTYVLYKKDFAKGQDVTLGLNGTTTSVVNYIALATKKGVVVTSAAPSTTPVPTKTPTTTPTPSTTPSTTPSPSTSQVPTTGSLKLSTDVSSWSGGYTMNITLTNPSSAAVDGWTLVLNKSDFTITSIWCAKMTETSTTYVITPETWNQSIGANGSTSFGFQGNGEVKSNFAYTIK